MRAIPLPGMAEAVAEREREQERRRSEARERVRSEARTLAELEQSSTEAFEAACLRLQRQIRDFLTWTQNN